MSRDKERSLRGPVRLALIAVLIMATAWLQACGANGSSNSNSKDKNAGASTGTETTTAAADTESKVPSVLNYGYIGSNDKNLPGGAEGWGFYKGIIQEELKKYGIEEVKLTGFPNGPDQTESLISGRLDFGGLGDTPAIIAHGSGAKTRLINQTNITNVGYLISGPDGPKTVEELKGKTIAIQKGSYMHRYVVGLLKQAGVKDYKLVHMLAPDGQAALARGDVDAMTNSGFNAEKQLAQGYTLIDDSSKHPELHGTSVTVVSESYLEKFPDFPKAWNEARLKAIEDLKQHEEEYYQFIADLNKTTVELAKKISPISYITEEPFPADGITRITGTKDFLVEEGLAKKDYKIEDWEVK
ncbi:NitT/TauT family transport system substrate-binding protein/sulfonate transport system substrate-binding protein [Paenibacillus catalpae]|uniref:NitT/TauT family transport system substrate-binding protein/sulfonate transport system substrate-binding protein n=1 Tax=Paenibacillus catalpae TaxID=1045775 RepID=A0A1I1WUG3_9BACL|nr:ABC transporter substrate-binding protein [Paenibacillus catalpae]SFD98834.1 NitT/TauT family transport system substrate-binding protein/sulfonate transport system substrate-binding protein [Paenibacillus catalpae]